MVPRSHYELRLPNFIMAIDISMYRVIIVKISRNNSYLDRSRLYFNMSIRNLDALHIYILHC